MEMDGIEPRTLTMAAFKMRHFTASYSTTSELVYFVMYHEHMLHYNYHVTSYSTGLTRLGRRFQNLSSRPVETTFCAYD